MKARRRSFDYDEARRLRASGLTLQQVADRLGVSRTAVMRAVLNPDARKLQPLHPKTKDGYPSNLQWLHPCKCGHLGRWHRGGRCRIGECGCDSFREDTIPMLAGDATWMRSGRRVSAHRTGSRAA